MTEAIFVLPQVPPGTPTPQGHDGSYFCSSPSTPRDSGSPQDPPLPPSKKVLASYSVGCKASLRLLAFNPSHIPFMGLRGRGNFRLRYCYMALAHPIARLNFVHATY